MKYDLLQLISQPVKYLHLCITITEEHERLLKEIGNDLDLSRAEVVSVILNDVLPDVKLQVQAIKEVDGR